MVINIKFHAADNSLLLLSNNNEPGKTTCLITFENVTANTAQIVFGSYTGPVTEVVNGSISLDVSGQIFSWPSAKTCYLIDTQTHSPITFQGGGTYNASDNLMVQEKDGVYYFERVLEDLRISNIINLIYPVGSVYTSVSDRNPSIWLGGTWVSFGSGRTLVGVDTGQSEFNSVEKPGGHKALQSHTHTFTGNKTLNESGGSHGHGFSLTAASKTLTGTTESLYTANQGNYSNGIVKSTKTSNRQYKTDGTTTNAWKQLTVNATHSHSVTGSITGVGGHQHYFTPSGSIGSSGGGDAQNLQPYITVFFWKRTK